MNTRKKNLSLALAAFSLAAFGMSANATMIHFNDFITGDLPASSPGPGGDWATATITNLTGSDEGVEVSLAIFVDYPEEFITHLFFDLTDDTASAASLTGATMDPDLALLTCNGKDPAGTGFWDICLQFDPSDHASSSDGTAGTIVFNILGSNLDMDDFGTSDDNGGWTAALHIQGIQPDCSAWVGEYDEQGRKEPGTPGTCVAVPEPGTLSLLGLGLVSVLGAGITNGRRRRLNS
jgi:hypothetical protein